MDRHMRRVGDQAALAVEHRAGKVEPFLDVDRIGGVLQRHPHLLGDRHEEMVEDLEHDGIGLGADRLAPLHRLDASEEHMVLRRDRGAPALFDDDRLVRLDDEHRPVDGRADWQRLAQIDIRLAPRAVGKETRHAGRSGRRWRGHATLMFSKARGAACRLDRHRLNGDRLGAIDEAEPAFVRAFERAPHRGGRR
jgi:hypothetical protein